MCLNCRQLERELSETSFAPLTSEDVSARIAKMNAIRRCANKPEPFTPFRAPSPELLAAMAKLDEELGLGPCLD